MRMDVDGKRGGVILSTQPRSIKIKSTHGLKLKSNQIKSF
jgi:hypothetical protein